MVSRDGGGSSSRFVNVIECCFGGVIRFIRRVVRVTCFVAIPAPVNEVVTVDDTRVLYPRDTDMIPNIHDSLRNIRGDLSKIFNFANRFFLPLLTLQTEYR